VKEVTSQQTARTMMRLLKEVTRSGTGASAAQLKHPIGGKTGTTSDFTDAWFLGFSPSVTCGVWVGYDSRQSLGEKMQGARVALPIWIDFMREAIKGKDNEQFSGDSQPATTLTAKAETTQSASSAKAGSVSGPAQAKPQPPASAPAKPTASLGAGAKAPVPPQPKPPGTTPASAQQVRPAMPAQTPTQTVPKPQPKPALPQ
jgi:penicillin-binding protein 1A